MFGTRKFNIDRQFIAYYKRDEAFKAIPIKSDVLPVVRTFRTPETLPLKEEDFKDTGAGEDYSESLLDFCKKNPELLQSVDFVMVRQILTSVAKSDDEMIVQAIRRNRVIYVNWYDKTTPSSTVAIQALGEGKAFMARLTGVENQPFYKIVARATVPLPNGRSAHVLYSGELDGVNEQGHHVEVKAIMMKWREWKKKRSPEVFWQSYLGLVDQVILGQKTKRNLEHYGRGFYREMRIENIIDTHSRSYESLELRNFMQSQEQYDKGIGRIKTLLTTLLGMKGDEVVLKRSNRVWKVCEAEVDQKFEDLVLDIP